MLAGVENVYTAWVGIVHRRRMRIGLSTLIFFLKTANENEIDEFKRTAEPDTSNVKSIGPYH
jgi:hypothetical protein